MKFPKAVRVKDRGLLDSFREKPCAVKNKDCMGTVSGHHIKTKGAGGGDTEDNLVALCFVHHRQIHDMGQEWFLEKYPNIMHRFSLN